MPFGRGKQTTPSNLSPDELFAQIQEKFDQLQGNPEFQVMKLGEAFECFEKSIQDECKPPDMSSKEWTLQKSKTYDRLAELHMMVHDHENAEKYFRLAMDLDGKNLEAGINFMMFLGSFGRLEESFAFFDEVYGDVAAPENVLVAPLYLFDKNLISSDKEAAEKLYLDSVRFGKALEAEFAPHKIAHHSNTKDPTRRLKVAYVSPDLNGRHAVARFSWAALGLDKSKVEVTVYNSKDFSIKGRGNMSHLVDRWVDVFKLNTRELVAKIVEDEIDILVDLAGFTGGNRLDAFSCCPAPVQVAWIGYPNTTGLSCMHYRVTDAVTDPVDTSQRFSEKLIRLPDCFLCHNIQTDEIMQKACASKDLPAVVSPPCLQNGYITFGCFNHVNKIQPAVLDLFVQILNQVPTSRINIKCGICFNAPCVREKWHAKFEAKGVARERVNLLASVEEHVNHMSLYGKHDISLDTFPYGGTTTTVDSLLMGVPVVTLRTPPSACIHAHNVSAGILTTLGLPDLIANSPDEYVHLASKLAANTERLVALRDNLRSDWAKSPMGDADRYRRNVEKMYQDMWGEYCEGSNWPPNSPDRDIA